MRRLVIASFIMLLAACSETTTQTEQQRLVDRSTLAMQEMLGQSTTMQNTLKQARAVMVCPQVFRAGFVFGGEGGGCVLLARDGGGSWSSPAFYGLGSGSVGFQAGVSDSMLMILIMTEKGLNAVMDSQFKFGGDAQVAVATLGIGVEGATTAALRADIVTWSRSRGLYAGLSLEGSVMGARSEWNQLYYGRSVSTRQIVIDMAAHNPGADPLREVLGRYGRR